MTERHKRLEEVLGIPEGALLQRAIEAKAASPALDGLGDPDRALRFLRAHLRASYLFGRCTVPSYLSAVFGALPELPPLSGAPAGIVAGLVELAEGELFTNNIFDRPGERRAHYHDAREAYGAAGGDLGEVEAFEADASEGSLACVLTAMAQSPLWSPKAAAQARRLHECAGDRFALFVLMPTSEALAPLVYARVLAALPRDERFGKARRFFERRVALDQGEHGSAALAWLELQLAYLDRLYSGRSLGLRRAAVLKVARLLS